MKTVEGTPKNSTSTIRSEKHLLTSARVKGVLRARKPLFQIPSHVLTFSLMMAPVAAAYVYYEKNKKSDRELEQILNKDSYYRENIITSQERRAELQNVFDNMAKPGSDVDLERRMMKAFHGGRSDQKRLYPVNKTLYGTEQGVAEKQRAVEESMRKEEERKTRRRNRKQAKSSDSSSDKESIQALREVHESDATLMKERNSSHNMDLIERRKRWSVAGTAVAAFVAIGVLVTGRPRSS